MLSGNYSTYYYKLHKREIRKELEELKNQNLVKLALKTANILENEKLESENIQRIQFLKKHKENQHSKVISTITHASDYLHHHQKQDGIGNQYVIQRANITMEHIIKIEKEKLSKELANLERRHLLHQR